MTRLDDYRNLAGAWRLPDKSQTWNLYGAGLESLKLEPMPIPQPADDQLLVRIDAVGICASDWKMISQGSAHARMKGRDLAKEPTVPGHEVSMTVVAVGAGLEGRYRAGERYAVQAEIYIDGAYVETTPVARSFSLTPGVHEVSLRNPAFKTVTRRVLIEPARLRKLKITLDRTNE